MAKTTRHPFGPAGRDPEIGFSKANEHLSQSEPADGVVEEIEGSKRPFSSPDERIQVWRVEDHPDEPSPAERRQRRMDDIFRGK